MLLSRRARALALAFGIVSLVPVASASAAPQSRTFGWDTVTQQFTVPAGVNQIHLNAWGGSGGSGGSRSNRGIYAAPGGVGARIDADVAVIPGATLRIDVGGRGGFGFSQTPGDGATAGGSARGGGAGGTVNNRDLDGTAGGGGGGATTVRNAAGVTVLVAGGGGGGGGGGISIAGNNGGQGGDAGSATSGACDPNNGPGTYGHGGGGGAGGSCAAPGNGPAGVGGGGEAPGSGAGTGGGGGGGFFGGGGGRAGGNGGGGGGGGGAGTSYWSSLSSDAVITNGGPGYGGVVVSWDAAPPAGVPRTKTLGGGDRFVVPPGVTELTVRATGGSGGRGSAGVDQVPGRGGYGAAIRGRVTVRPGDELAIQTGGAGGNGIDSSGQTSPVPGGTAGGGGGGAAGAITVSNSTAEEMLNYVGGTGGGGGGATQVIDTTTATTLVTAGGGGGGGGNPNGFSGGFSGGSGGNAGSPLVTGAAADGDGLFGSGASTPGTANGAGGGFASSAVADGENAANSTEGNARGTGGGAGGGVRGGGAGRQCTGGSCTGSAGGAGAGSSAWVGSARDVVLGNSLAGNGVVRIDWIGKVATTTAIDASRDVIVAGTPLTLTATIAGEDVPPGAKPSGTVLFIDEDNGSSLGAPVALSEGKAALTTTLTAGTHRVYAAYEGDSLFLASTSPRRAETAIERLSVQAATPPAVVGVPYKFMPTVANGTGPFLWTLIDGDTPGGIDFNSATGEISGTPTTPGTTEFTLRVTDSGNPRQSADVPVTFIATRALAIGDVTPSELVAGSENAIVTVTGQSLRPGAELTASDPRITFSAVDVKGATTLTARVTVPGDVPAGAYDVTVKQGTASATCSTCLRIQAKPSTPPATPTATPTPAPDTPAAGGGTTPPAPPSAGTAAAAPRLTLVRKPVTVRGNRVRFTVRCTGATCSGQVTGTARRRTVTTARFTLAAGTTRTVTLRLNARGRALVTRTRRLPVTVTIAQRADRRLQTISRTRVTVRSRHR